MKENEIFQLSYKKYLPNSLVLDTKNESFLDTDQVYNIIKTDYENQREQRAIDLLDVQKVKPETIIRKYTKFATVSKQLRRPPKINKKSDNSLIPPPISRQMSSSSLTKKDMIKKKERPLNKSCDSKFHTITDKKIDMEKILTLKAKFFRKEKMTRGELVEMTYGKEVPFVNLKDSKYLGANENYSEEYQKKVNDVICNNPRLIVDLIEKGSVSEEQIIDHFNLKALSIQWNDKLEQIFREIVYNKNKTNSNMLKTTYFLINIGFHRVIKEKFDQRHLVDLITYNEKEIQEIFNLHERIKKTPLEVITNACLKLESIFHKKDELVHQIITNARNEYYDKNVKKFREKRRVEERIIKEANILTNKEKEDYKQYLCNIRRKIKKIRIVPNNTEISPKKPFINRLTFKSPLISLNKNLYTKQDVNNITYKDRLTSSKNFIKVLVNNGNKVHLPSDISMFNKLKRNDRILITFHVTKIQSYFKGYMIRKYLNLLNKHTLTIQKALKKYVGYKSMVIKLFEVVDDKSEFSQLLRNYKNSDKIKYIRILVNSLFRNYKNCFFYLSYKNRKLIKDFSAKFLQKPKILIPNKLKSYKLLFFIDNCLFDIYTE